jgi:hypothetical protein
LRRGKIRFGRFAIPFNSLYVILRHALTAAVVPTVVELGLRYDKGEGVVKVALFS